MVSDGKASTRHAFPSVVNSTASKISMFWLESASYRSNIIFILLALSLHCVSERYGHYYRMSGNILYRDLVKAYGTLLIFHIHGEGGKFNFINAMLTLGSIAAIFGVATVVCDFLFSYVFKVRAGYQKRKCADLFEDDIKKLLEKMETKQVADDKLPPEPSSFHPPKAPIVKARTAKSAAEMSKVLKC